MATPSNNITGRAAFLSVMKDEGVTRMFGNPGTTELPIMHALTDEPDITYTMALQESVVVAMADGYSRASGRLTACNVHVAPGLGNAMGSLYNAEPTSGSVAWLPDMPVRRCPMRTDAGSSLPRMRSSSGL